MKEAKTKALKSLIDNLLSMPMSDKKKEKPKGEIEIEIVSVGKPIKKKED